MFASVVTFFIFFISPTVFVLLIGWHVNRFLFLGIVFAVLAANVLGLDDAPPQLVRIHRVLPSAVHHRLMTVRVKRLHLRIVLLLPAERLDDVLSHLVPDDDVTAAPREVEVEKVQDDDVFLRHDDPVATFLPVVEADRELALENVLVLDEAHALGLRHHVLSAR